MYYYVAMVEFLIAVRLTNVELKLKLHDLAIKESDPTASRLEKLKWQPN
jgi:hypothetical protein